MVCWEEAIKRRGAVGEWKGRGTLDARVRKETFRLRMLKF